MAGVWRRIVEWGTLEKLGTIADLLVKITALVAALAAANFFYYQPEVKLETDSQAFIDIDALGAAYSADQHRLPDLVRGVAEDYNRANTKDLGTGRNSTSSLIPAKELCAGSPDAVRLAFPGSDCTRRKVTLGRSRYYERLLIRRNQAGSRPLGTARLRQALRRLQAAEYLKVRCAITNVGNANAADVQIRASDGFFRPRDQVNDPFALTPNAGHPVHRDFQSGPGAFDQDPQLEFGIDWSRGSLTDTGPLTIVASILLLSFVLVLINDFLKAARAKREEAD